jgi:UDP-galactopyranose mutase
MYKTEMKNIADSLLRFCDYGKYSVHRVAASIDADRLYRIPITVFFQLSKKWEDKS